MKNQFLKLVFATMMVGMMTTSCSSERSAGMADSTKMDSGKMISTPAPSDSVKKDSIMKTDTTRTP